MLNVDHGLGLGFEYWRGQKSAKLWSPRENTFTTEDSAICIVMLLKEFQYLEEIHTLLIFLFVLPR